ncbi:TonB-linked outer membrane protein, SusC/RagA family [Mucilaginibacter pineti]|uniref:TonB-linked outer membrane protein, SusC/RagA family n=1 Tax=Mucilaginibacter pineti TaxID=1391627 RepID=A0A1G7D8C7_9SPHI|nr:TonB-dependent receptor [Mucilaginibacter pineti]SDE47894.1 TonB-linked outer membrane protein, SusC/RagA family [Mucilaginibacter pineti]
MKEIFTNHGGCRGIHYPVKFKKVVQHCIASLLFLLMCTAAFAQGNKITGVVSDEKGLPLPGVSVLLKGTQNGTVTDVNGKFNINATATQTLVFTFLGYTPKEVLVGDQTTINISMAQASNSINEVVVVGYGTQKKVSITGSVAAVTSKDIVTTKNENVLNMLTGKVAGLRIVQNSAEPGNFDNSFDIRGFGQPLVVIDGIPRDNITRLDPNDIESVSVLKDGSAAVYGVRAANGVILVTTKKGKKGTLELNYSGTWGIEKPSGLPKPVGAIDFMTLVNEQQLHNVNGGQIKYTDADFAAYRNGTKQSTDWYSPVISNSAPQSQHTLSATGGSDNTTYFMSMGITNQDGFLKSDDLKYKRYNLRSNITSKISKDLTVDLNLNATMDQKDQPYQDAWWIIRSFWRSVPTQSIYANNNPAYLQNGQVDGTNPVALSNSDVNGYKTLNNKWFQSSISATYAVPFVPGLSAKGLFSYDYYMSSNKIYQKAYNLYDYDAASNVYKPVPNQTPATIQRQFYEKPTTLTQLSLNYTKAFRGGHNVTGLLLYEESERTGDNINAQRELSLPVDQLLAGNSFNQVGSTDSGTLFDFVNKAVIGRVNYDYNSKYLLEFSFRRDGSSYFSPAKQYGFFPGGSIGWRISQENFFKNSSALSFVDELKLRLSYAQVGDDSALSYQFLQGYTYPASGSNNQLPPGSVFDGTFVNGVQSKGIANPNLTWQNAKLYNIGIDLQAWKGLLGLTFDVYRRDKTGEFATRALNFPSVVGADLPQENLNSSRVQGFDFELNHRNHIGEFNYFLKATFAYNRFTRLHNESGAYGNSQLNYQGNQNNRYQGILYGQGSNGQYTSYQDILNSPVFVNRGTVVGDYKYEDWNGDGVINGQDAHPIAYNGAPLISYGLTIGASYKGFDFNTLWQGAADVDVSYFEQLNTPLFGGGSALTQFLDRYHPADPKADPYDPNTVWIPGHYAYTGTVADQNSLANVESAAYLRLKTAEIGYSLTSGFAKKIGIKGARVFLNGYNVFTITKLKYLDPEHPSSTYGYLYPLNKIFSLGVNVKL